MLLRVLADPLVAATVSVTGTAAVVAASPPQTGNPVLDMLPYCGTIIGPALVFLVSKLAPPFLRGRRAKKAALAAAKRRRAAELLADKNLENDHEAQKLLDQADADDADAAELEELSGSNRKSP